MDKNAQRKETKTIGSVLKAIEIVELLASTEKEIGTTEISQQLQYGVSATYHLLNTLKSCQVIEQDPRTKKYHLGMKLWKFGKVAREQNHLTSFIQPYLKKLQILTGETANLTILDQQEIVYVAQEESEKLIRMFTQIGARVPLHCSAAGKVLLAYQPQGRQTEIIHQLPFKRFTPKTVVEETQLKKELEEIARQGYAFDDEEREIGVSCIAAPIFDFDGEVLAAMSISGPIMRFDTQAKAKMIPVILGVTREISYHLGYKE